MGGMGMDGEWGIVWDSGGLVGFGRVDFMGSSLKLGTWIPFDHAVFIVFFTHLEVLARAPGTHFIIVIRGLQMTTGIATIKWVPGALARTSRCVKTRSKRCDKMGSRCPV